MDPWLTELRLHGAAFMAVIKTVKEVFPTPEIIKYGIVAIVTAVLSAQITVARLDERLEGLMRERAVRIRILDQRDSEVKRDLSNMQSDIRQIQADHARMKK